MGLWALEQGNPELAASYFGYAVQYDYKKAVLYHAIALTEDGQRNRALIAWDSVATSQDEEEREMAFRVKNILTLSREQVETLADPEKYQFCRYRLHVMDTVLFDRLINTFENANYKAKALLDMTQRLFEWNKLRPAIRYFNQIGGLELTDRNLYEEIRHTELLLLAERRELRKLAEQINDNISFGPERFLEKTLYTALLNEASGDTVNAGKNYEILANYNPYFEEGVIAASQYFRTHSQDYLKAYTILAEALQTNNTSPKLIQAYAAEAIRIEFDHYAVSALQRLEELIAKRQNHR
jgi:predicted RNase H-like nuclease